MAKRLSRVAALASSLALAALLASCGGSSSGSSSTSTSPTSSTSATASTGFVWKGSPVSSTAIPLGDGHLSTTPKAGYVDSCVTNFQAGQGASVTGPWINTAAGTWNSQEKISVQGSVAWPNASNSVSVQGSNRVLRTNDLPKEETTGNFPISPSDPAYQYDHNPNHIAAQSYSWTVPATPTAAASPSCTGLGPIGMTTDGVVLFNALDATGRDAVAHEMQDSCDGHPDMGDVYHYHDVSRCLMTAGTMAAKSSTLVGYALDGYGIYVERDAKGNLPSNADLDACHGRTSKVMWNGKLTSIYHYDATLEYPYTVGCFHGTPVSSQQGVAGAGGGGNGTPASGG